MGGAVGMIITLVMGIGIATLILIFVGSMSGSVYEQVEPDIDAITNTTIKDHVKNGVISGFDALEQTGSYLPIIVLAVIISVVLALVMSLGGIAGGRGGGSAL